MFCEPCGGAAVRKFAQAAERPPAALALHAAGEALPLWMASAGDRFVCTGISSRWLDRMRATFDIGDVDVYNHHDSSLEACPWGWSAASRRALIDAGYPASQLPSDTTLRSLRELSHRRTAARLAERAHWCRTRKYPGIRFLPVRRLRKAGRNP